MTMAAVSIGSYSQPPPVVDPGEVSPVGSPGICVNMDVVVYCNVSGGVGGFGVRGASLTDFEIRTEPMVGTPQFTAGQYYSKGFSTTFTEVTDDGFCSITSPPVTGIVWNSGTDLYIAFDLFHHYIARSGASGGIWKSSDGIAFTQLSGCVVSGVGPTSKPGIGKTTGWALFHTTGSFDTVFYFPESGGTPVEAGAVTGGLTGQVLGAVHTAIDDDSYCLIQHQTGGGFAMIRVDADHWWDITPAFPAMLNNPDANPGILSIDGQVWIALTAGGIARSADAGFTWSIVHGVAVGASRAAISYSRTQQRWFVALAAGGFVYSDDDGVTWTAHPTLTGTVTNISAVGSSS